MPRHHRHRTEDNIQASKDHAIVQTLVLHGKKNRPNLTSQRNAHVVINAEAASTVRTLPVPALYPFIHTLLAEDMSTSLDDGVSRMQLADLAVDEHSQFFSGSETAAGALAFPYLLATLGGFEGGFELFDFLLSCTAGGGHQGVAVVFFA